MRFNRVKKPEITTSGFDDIDPLLSPDTPGKPTLSLAADRLTPSPQPLSPEYRGEGLKIGKLFFELSLA